MIAKLIDFCIKNRMMVLILSAFLVAAGIWSIYHIRVDAIPDLSDVQVIIFTDYSGQAPQIVEDQVTYPLAKSMLAVPRSKAVRGYSMFGASFVYIIFEDGTDLYWARSRVLERLSYAAAQLPRGVSPQIGPDATGVGWVYEYVLTTGRYCPKHPNGLWHDPAADRWYENRTDAPGDTAVQGRLVHHRIFEQARFAYFDPQDRRRYERPEDAPADVRPRLEKTELAKGYDRCPLDGSPLADSQQTLASLRTLQDWFLRYELTAVSGVSEVATIGGFEKQYQVLIDPVKLLALRMPLSEVKMAIERSNLNVGGRVVEWSEREYAVQGLGYLGTLTDQEIAEARARGQSLDDARTQKVLADLRKVSLGATEQGSPIYLRDVASIQLGPEMRRGAMDWNGQGEAVGGIVVMRFGENARTTIGAVVGRLEQAERSLPPGVAVEMAYDRSDLIDRSIATLSDTLIEEIAVVSLVVLIFLLHARSALVAVFTLPTGVLASIVAMHVLGINANIMSLGGIAIAIGVMVDSSIVMVENAHKHLEREKRRVAGGEPPRPRAEVVADAAREVGPTLFFSLAIIVVSFLPIFVLGEQAGRLFKPLAYTKTFAMAAGALLAVTLIPVLMAFLISEQVIPTSIRRWRRVLLYLLVIVGVSAALAVIPLPHLEPYRWVLVIGWLVASSILLLPQKVPNEDRHPISRFLQAVYDPAFRLVMRFRWLTLLAAVAVVALTVFPFLKLGTEFMPPLEEGDLLYMPTTDPGLSMTKARELLQQTDKLIAQFPEVKTVMGKTGRAETATDPAPISMFETTITLERDKHKWRHVSVPRFHADWPGWLRRPLRNLWPDSRPITVNELIYGYELPGAGRVPGLNEVVQVPGLTNSWTMPIRTRIDMLSTGIKTPVGIKIMGPDLATLSDLADRTAQVIRTDARTGPHTTGAFAEKTVGGSYLDIAIHRDDIARYSLSVADVQDVIASAMGGMEATRTVEGLERYTVNLRYPSELRDSLAALRQTLVTTPARVQVPLGQLAAFTLRNGPDMIRSENARLTAWVYVDITGIDVGTYVRDAKAAVESQVKLPEGQGYSIIWSGQYEYMQEANRRLAVVIPVALVLIILLLYMASRSWLRVGIVLLAVPFSLVGAVWLLYLLDYNLSLAVWVGVIALAGLDAETGMVMLLYLDTSFERFKREDRLRNAGDLWQAIHDGAVKRIRPKTMTVLTTFTGLVPLLWAAGAGADTMRRLAAPMIGGLATSFLMELLIYPVIFYTAKRIALARQFQSGGRREK